MDSVLIHTMSAKNLLDDKRFWDKQHRMMVQLVSDICGPKTTEKQVKTLANKAIYRMRSDVFYRVAGYTGQATVERMQRDAEANRSESSDSQDCDPGLSGVSAEHRPPRSCPRCGCPTD
jgi:hypothetical protein